MAEINYLNQVRYTGSGYLDAKMQPVATYDDLLKIPRSQRFIGLEVVVLSDTKNGNGKQTKYWLKNGTANSNWVIKNDSSLSITGDDVEI